MAVPAIALTAAFILYPIVESLRLSFLDWDGLGQASPAGTDNFAELAGDPSFVNAATNNLLFAVLATAGTVGLGTLLALALHQHIPAWRFFRVVLFLPVTIPITVVAIFWTNALDPSFGVVNKALALIDPGFGHAWLSDPATVMWVIIAVSIWQFAGFPMLVMLAAFKSQPVEIGEAATLDGAGAVTRARYVTVPMAKEVLATITLVQIIFSFKIFDIVWVMTQGGPGSASEVLGTLIYKEAFQFQRFGYASAIAVVASALIIAISLTYLYLSRPQQIERHG